MYFKEIVLDENNKFTLDFSQTDQIYKVLFLPKKDYFITSMNCNPDIQEDIKNNVFDEIKELSEKAVSYSKKVVHIKMMLKECICGWVFQDKHMKIYTFTLSCLQQI